MFFDPPAVGALLAKDSSYAEVESVKAVSDVIAPLSGEIIEVNGGLVENPELVNEDPYGEGWLVKVRMSDPSERDALLDAASYRAGLAGDDRSSWLVAKSLSRYTAITPTDLDAMLAAIGVGSLEELFERQIPRTCACASRWTCPRGGPSRRSSSTCARSPSATAASSSRSASSARGCTTTTCRRVGRHADRALGVPDPLHALPARGRPGRAAGDVRVPDRDLRADRAAGLQRLRVRGRLGGGGGRLHGQARTTDAPRIVVSEACTRTRSRRSDLRPRLRHGGARGAHPRRRHRRRGLGRRDRRRHQRGDLRAAELPRRGRGRGRAQRGRAARRGDGPVVVAQVDPITLGVLAPPGDCGVDVAVGEGQPLGNRLDFGGPSFGFFAAREEYLRRMPGRIAGATQDLDGRRGFVLTLQTREQHIRRERATSNICTAQALNALAGVVYLSWLGRARDRRARRAAAGPHPLRARAAGRDRGGREAPRAAGRARVRAAAGRRRRRGAPPLPAKRASTPASTLHALSGLERDRGGLLVALTERRTRADIDRLVEVLGAALEAERPAGSPAEKLLA